MKKRVFLWLARTGKAQKKRVEGGTQQKKYLSCPLRRGFAYKKGVGFRIGERWRAVFSATKGKNGKCGGTLLCSIGGKRKRLVEKTVGYP